MDIELADAVAAVRDELLKAQSRGAASDLVFEVGPLEMEFEVELRADAKVGGKFRVWAVSADAEAGVSRGATHRVTFTLTPRLRDGRPALLIHGDPDAPAGPGDLDGYVEN
ncbi:MULTISPECIES: trypco2 family protein [Kitasatospora]|uniref:Trypsin-co-occurring domain-containing protein n=1 Tax=Kitasatospora setae (strain ATCC 33774 / DSM 43861 / JCM 3304 / KCC A-0304 / NBRC 14216 / KM-6054) TaxID=452652 RepID=E4N6A3_KITSK|nr:MULTISPECIES: trypco2 family protein [Kitasatospora]BAJ26734.1 hypothetical protein KSE_08970 [Kitasatospora setae KM-6054]